jgi:outer membrane protein OmpA-like peptidoglycan-associated protein
MRLVHLISFILFAACNSQITAQTFELNPLKCNSKYNDFAAITFADGIVFCSDRPSTVAIQYLDAENKNPTKLYFSDQGGKSAAKLFTASITTKMNEGPGCFNAAKDEFYYTGTICSPNSKKNRHLGIFVSTYNGTDWSSAQGFEYNSPDSAYSIAHPTLSYDGKTLYFASDMDGGQGSKDLYKCERTASGWSKPENLGATINSKYAEIFPFVSQDGKQLYFASSREEGTGLDIYKSDNINGNWTKPVKLDEPINSDKDDFAFVINPDATTGYITSNRNGKNDDLYEFNLNYPMFEGCPPAELPTFCYLFEELNIIPNDSTPMTYEWEFGDGTVGSGLSSEHCYETFGEYNVGLNVYDSRTKAKFARVSEVDVIIEKSPFPFITSIDSSMVMQDIAFSPEGTDIENFNIENYFWDFGDGARDIGHDVKHTYVAPGIYTVQLGLVGMDKTEGTEQKRCATKQIAVGTTEQLMDLMTNSMNEGPVESVLHNDMTFANDEETQKLVHTLDSSLYFVQFKESNVQISLEDPYFDNVIYEITERFVEKDTLYKYSVGNSTDVNELLRIQNDLKANGYESALIRQEKSETFKNTTTNKWWFMPDSINSGINNHINKFSDIRFGLNAYVIQPQSFDNLTYIAQLLLLEPSFKLRIMAHTDSIGTEENNLKLSQNRAQAVVDYLVSKGVEKDRLLPEGYGENAPAASNADETGRARNRRVSFAIIINDKSNKGRRSNK